MHRIALHSLGRSLFVALSAALVAACADGAPVAPGARPTAAAHARSVDLGSCDSLAVEEGNVLAAHLYASGVQIYRWNGTSWGFVAPRAELYADAGGNGTVGTHYAGPTWESASGGKVAGAVARRCPAGANAIPWLLLKATPDDGPGIFHRTTFIQRVNTAGGTAPAAPGSVVGEEARVPYTAEYLFYRAQ